MQHLFVDDDAIDIESHYTVQSTDDEHTLSTSKGAPGTYHNAGTYVPAPQVPPLRVPEPRHMSGELNSCLSLEFFPHRL